MEILTGNELISGAAVYLSRDGVWVEDIQQARLFQRDEKDAREAALEASKATGRIVSLEFEKASMVEGRVVPDRLRERIRVSGPTAPVVDRQHLGEGDNVSI